MSSEQEFILTGAMKKSGANIEHENCEMAIAISSSRADPAPVPGVVFKWI